MDVLTTTPCSLASANQRAGRAGRTSAGKCFRLYPASILPTTNPSSPMPLTTPPELVRSDISLYLLQLKALGIDNLAKFDFMSPPPSEMMIRALEFLFCLKAIDDEGRLTRPMGERMAEVPLDPMMAAIVSGHWKDSFWLDTEDTWQLLNSHEFRCGEEILTIAAMTSVQVSSSHAFTIVSTDLWMVERVYHSSRRNEGYNGWTGEAEIHSGGRGE